MKYILFFAFSSMTACLFSQNGVDIWTNGVLSSDPSSILGINSDDKGLLIPRMTSEERSLINEPAEGLMVFQTDMISGFYFYSGEAWEKIQDEMDQVPLGMVIEWWRPNANFPIPDGYAICDGSLVSDPESPYDGINLPNLLYNFVKGVTDTAQIGTTETGIHAHDFDIPNITVESAGEHSHSMNVDVSLSDEGGHNHTIDQGVVLTNSYSHRHRWSSFYIEDNTFPVPDDLNWQDGDGSFMMSWSDGMDGDGADYFTLGVDEGILGSGTAKSFYTDYDNHNHSLYGTVSQGGTHSHNYIRALPTVSTTGAHTHTYDLPTQTSAFVNDISPPFYGLVKIIKIK
jgi:hypothetical protein